MKRQRPQDTSHLATSPMQQFRSRITRSKSFSLIVCVFILVLIGVSTFYASATSTRAAMLKGQTSQATGTPTTSTEVQAAQTSANNWPMFLHDPQHTSASSDTTLSTTKVAHLTKLWSFTTGGTIAASATVVGGNVYVGSWDGYEYALNATTGAMIWKTYLGITTADSNCYPPTLGITSTAAVENGVVYVGGGDSYWYALNATNGAVLWKVYTGDNSATGGHYNWSSPLLYKGYAYIGIASEGDCPLVQGQLLKVSLSTHQVVNTYNFVPDGQVGGGLWTTPALDPTTNTLYVATATEASTDQTQAQAIIAISASTLTAVATWHLPESEAVYDSDFGTSPVLYTDASGNPMLAVTNKNGYVYALNRNNLAAGPVWQDYIAIGGDFPAGGDGSVSSPSYGGGRIYVAGGKVTINGIHYQGSVDAIDPTTGKFLWQHTEPGIVIGATAYDNGLVFAGGGNIFEVLDASTGARLYNYATGGQIYDAASEAHGKVFVGSTDGNLYAFNLGSKVTPPHDSHCPTGWTCQDIGKPAPAGLEGVSNGTWSVTAGGNGVGGNSDQFRFASQTVSGDTQITAQVASQQTTGGTAQAGLMLRQRNDPGSPYYAVFLEQGTGVVVQYRTAFGGGTTTDVQMTSAAPPLYLEIQRVGDQFQAATSTDGVKYTLLPGGTANVVMPNAVMEGLATSSGVSGTPGSASYSAVAIGQPTTPPTPVPPSNPCPTNWNCQDIGDPAIVGNQSLSGNTWTLQGAGFDIWFFTDQFHYVWQSLPADGGVSAQVLTQTYTNPWVKTGVMLRQSTDPASPYYAVLVTPTNGIVVQYRDIQGDNTVQVAATAGAVPTYLWAVRKGTTFSAYTSSDGVSWTLIPGSSISLNNLTGTLLAGLATTSHDTTVLGTATFNAVSVSASTPMNLRQQKK